MREAEFKIAVGDYDETTTELTEQVSSLDENRLDTAIGVLVNDSLELGWLEENKGVVDLQALDISEELQSDLSESPLLSPVKIDASGLEGRDHMPDAFTVLPLGYRYITTADFDDEI